MNDHLADPRRRLLLSAGITGAGILLSSQSFGYGPGAEKSRKHARSTKSARSRI
jgi:hypothetical protein